MNSCASPAYPRADVGARQPREDHTFADQQAGWVFVGYPDEVIRRWLRPGTVRLWDDARSIAKQEDELVLFLQLGEKGASWEGSGRVVGPEERWKAFGVTVRCTRVLDRGLPAVPSRTPPPAQSDAVATPGGPPEEAWENRALAAAVGIHRFRTRTPYLDPGRDLRLTSSDLRGLVDLQPGLAELLAR